MRKASADGFGAGEKTGVLDRSEVTSRGTGTATRTPLEEFEAKTRAEGLFTHELRCFWTCVMFLTRLPCPGWCHSAQLAGEAGKTETAAVGMTEAAVA